MILVSVGYFCIASMTLVFGGFVVCLLEVGNDPSFCERDDVILPELVG